MKILIADKFEPSGLDALRSAGCDVTFEPSLSADALRDEIVRCECDVLVVRSTKVTGEMLNAGDRLSLVVRAGAGYNTIDVDAASRHSVLVANCPGKNSVAVAELTFALILALDRRVVDNVTDLRKGVWNKAEYAKAAGLKDRTIGLIGMGRIGRAVAKRAIAFEMNVLGWGRTFSEEAATALAVLRCDSPAEVASRCDILSIHLAATAQTRNLVDANVLAKLKPGSTFINTARADVVDYTALAAAMSERQLRVGLDVYPDEPSGGKGAFSNAMVADGLCYGTHHIGASTQQAQNAIAAETVRIVTTFHQTGRVLNCVNFREPVESHWCLRVRHLNEPGVLAHVFSQLTAEGINVEEMENSILAGAKAGCAHIRLDAEPSTEVMERISQGCESVLAVSLMRGDA